jgi:small-conductance mechanosensitive channel
VEEILGYRLFRIGDTSVTTASLVAAIVLLVATYLLARLSRRLVADRLLARTHLSLGVRYMLGRLTGYVILVLGVLASLQTVGIRATTLTAFGAALGVGIGFGLQDIAKNFVSGLILLVERPIQVGDRIEIGNVSGDVTEIRMRATVIRTNDDVHWIVPNAKFIGDTVTNRSFGRPRVRYRVPVGVGYATPPREVEKALLAAAARSENVLKDPPPDVWFTGFGDSSLDFELLCWTEKMLHRPGVFRSQLNYLIHEELTRRGIEIPFPQRDVHIRTPRPLSTTGGTEAAESSPGGKP